MEETELIPQDIKPDLDFLFEDLEVMRVPEVKETIDKISLLYEEEKPRSGLQFAKRIGELDSKINVSYNGMLKPIEVFLSVNGKILIFSVNIVNEN